MGPYRSGQFPRKCSKCGVEITEVRWGMLPHIGVQNVPADPTDAEDPDAYQLELRNCRCGTTLAVILAPAEP